MVNFIPYHFLNKYDKKSAYSSIGIYNCIYNEKCSKRAYNRGLSASESLHTIPNCINKPFYIQFSKINNIYTIIL